MTETTTVPQDSPTATPTWNVGSRRARRNERRLFLRVQPAAWLLIQYAQRRNRDVCRIPGLGYVVSGAEVAREVVTDGATYAKAGASSSTTVITQMLGPVALVNMPDIEHLALRRQLQDLFTPKYSRQIIDAVLGDLVVDLRARLAAGETVDLVHFSHVLTGSVICHLNGMQLEGEALERRATEMYEIGLQIARLVPLRMKRLDEATVALGHELLDRLLEGVEESFRSGGPDTIPGRLRTLGLTYEQARGVIAMIILAGTETTSTAIPRITALLHDTGQWERLRAHPELLDATIDEGLRIVAPVPLVTRSVAHDHKLRGVQLRKDRLILTFLTSALRDPRVIKDGNSFDIGRETPRPLRHLHFSAGAHFCLGFSFAKREIAIVLEALRDLDAPVEVVARTAARNVLLPSYASLHIRQVRS
ncbi:MAG: Cytochrome [Thermoleophilia bacterium]|nr:Cytochrome [Thermoleophilia bacterium]MCZ4496686.1 Cytochrome [Thermoleophilia bacterium]